VCVRLCAIALLWGLTQASGRQLPVEIDTPLGRLDSEHRHHLVESDRHSAAEASQNAYPVWKETNPPSSQRSDQNHKTQASHQVMLLSTDTEIRQAEVTQLRAAGAIVFGGPSTVLGCAAT
jgi:DNA sulfur modification protein DndD